MQLEFDDFDYEEWEHTSGETVQWWTESGCRGRVQRKGGKGNFAAVIYVGIGAQSVGEFTSFDAAARALGEAIAKQEEQAGGRRPEEQAGGGRAEEQAGGGRPEAGGRKMAAFLQPPASSLDQERRDAT